MDATPLGKLFFYKPFFRLTDLLIYAGYSFTPLYAQHIVIIEAKSIYSMQLVEYHKLYKTNDTLCAFFFAFIWCPRLYIRAFWGI